MRHARTQVRVELVAASQRELLIVVEDDGPGIDRELLPRLFEAFAQGSGRTGAAGMGLSTVRAIVNSISSAEVKRPSPKRRLPRTASSASPKARKT